MRRSYGLILGHRISLHAAAALPNAAVTGNSQARAVMVENGPPGALRDGQN
jgi:hypothetical protein